MENLVSARSGTRSSFIGVDVSGRQPIMVAGPARVPLRHWAKRYWAKQYSNPAPPVATKPGCVQSRDMCDETQECW
jgi:hypothetical protein